MVAQEVFQRMAKFAGKGIVVGGAIYYTVKEYGFSKFGRIDLLKDSYRNLKTKFDIKKVCLPTKNR